MLDFAEELKKYKPALEVDDLEQEIAGSDAQDVIKLLQYIFKKRDYPDKE